MGSRECTRQAVGKGQQLWSSSLGVDKMSATPRIVLCTTSFTVQKFNVLSAECIYVFCTFSEQTAFLFPMLH
jgi:hypothetical protein